MECDNHLTQHAPADRPSFPVSRLDYHLPPELIAQTPPPNRGESRLLVVNRAEQSLRDRSIRDLPEYLAPGDVMVLNDTRVLPARFALLRKTGGRIEGLFLSEPSAGVWDVMLKGSGRLRAGEMLQVEGDKGGVEVIAREPIGRGQWRVDVGSSEPAASILGRVGRMPLPPYIKRDKSSDPRDPADRDRYQTVYAARDGAVAAPTAGLHFTKGMLDEIRAAGVHVETVTLHVGIGTFAPIEVDDLRDHPMHAEYVELSQQTANRLSQSVAAGRKVTAVGTTTVRALESAWRHSGWTGPYQDWTRLFCYPPCTFGPIHQVLTNFHLPRSTLLAMIMALAGTDLTRQAYAQAAATSYRFYSYGDAMLIV